MLIAENPGVFDANPDLPVDRARSSSPPAATTSTPTARSGPRRSQQWTGYSKFLYDQGLLTGPDGKPLTAAARLRRAVHERLPAVTDRPAGGAGGPAARPRRLARRLGALRARRSGVSPFVLPAPSPVLAALWDFRASLAAHQRSSTLGRDRRRLRRVARRSPSPSPSPWTSCRPCGGRSTRSSSARRPSRSSRRPARSSCGSASACCRRSLVIVLLTFFPIVVGLLDGFAGVPPEASDLLETFGASRRQALVALRWPSALPSFFTGLRIAATYAVVGSVYAEYVGSFDGLGIWILTSSKAFRVDLVFGAVLIVVLISVAAFAAVVALERLLVPWAGQARRARG